MRCFERLLSLLPSSFTQWVKFLYIKNDTLFFVFHHPCAKMEFNYKRNLIKSLLSQMSLHAPECSSLHVKEIQCFVSHQNNKEEEKLFTQNGEIFYVEKASGAFENACEDPKLHALFEAIRQEITQTPSC